MVELVSVLIIQTGHTLSIVDASSSINLKTTNSNNNGAILLSGRDNAGISFTSKINARNHGALDIELDTFASNTFSSAKNYRKLRIFGVIHGDALTDPGVVVAFGGTFRNGSDQVGIASVGIGTITPLGRFHIDLQNPDIDQNTFRISVTSDGGAPGIKIRKSL